MRQVWDRDEIYAKAKGRNERKKAKNVEEKEENTSIYFKLLIRK